jgi:hypothetical protein
MKPNKAMIQNQKGGLTEVDSDIIIDLVKERIQAFISINNLIKYFNYSADIKESPDQPTL